MLNIPKTVDMYDLLEEFIAPRLPSGYCIRVTFKKENITKECFHYFAKPKIKKTERNQEGDDELQGEKAGPTIKENLINTGSPRTYKPIIEFNRILKIKIDKPGRSSVIPKSSDNDVKNSAQSYLFSELIEDLNNLCGLESPLIDEEIYKVNLRLSFSQGEDQTARRFSGVFILRKSDIKAKSDEIKNENGSDVSDSSDSEEESLQQKSDDDDADENVESKKPQNDSTNLVNPYGKWSIRDVHDVRFNEDKFSIQFRTGRLGCFGFAINRYSNMPYQTWELKPDNKNPGGVFFSLTAAVINIEILITDEGYYVRNFQGGQTEDIKEMLGKLITMEELKEILINSGVDLFPEIDAFCYTEGSCEKNYIMEMHLYNCMASLALSHNFSWSRWNLLSGSRTAVLLMREIIEGKKIPNYSTLLVTPLRTIIIECTEVSASFNTTGISGMEFYSDLYHLALAHSHPTSKLKQESINPALRENVAEILIKTRPLSFC